MSIIFCMFSSKRKKNLIGLIKFIETTIRHNCNRKTQLFTKNVVENSKSIQSQNQAFKTKTKTSCKTDVILICHCSFHCVYETIVLRFSIVYCDNRVVILIDN